MAKPKTRYGHPGLLATNYPRSVRYKVDYDYLDKLTDAEKTFLENVTNEVVGGTGDGYPGKNAANRDMYTHPESEALFHTYYGDVQGASKDCEQTPEYLETDAYKAALRGFRTHVHDNWRRVPELTMGLMRAKKRLQKAKGKG